MANPLEQNRGPTSSSKSYADTKKSMKTCGLSVILLTACSGVVLVGGCSSLARQARATTHGLKVSYEVRKEDLSNLSGPLAVVVLDRRDNKDPVGAGAKPTIGTHLVGYLVLGVTYATFQAASAAIGPPTIASELSIPDAFEQAFAKRFVANGVNVANRDAANHVLKVELQTFSIDFSLGTWTAEARYRARVDTKGSEVCKQVVAERMTRFNVWGYASAEAALSDVFNAAVNAFDPSKCEASA
jgi:hypothetical protein